MTIAAWGDSITYGACDEEALGWVGRLRKSLPTDDFTNVYNFGICGDTTEDVLKRFEIEADNVEPEIIVFAVGINDSKFPSEEQVHKVPLEQYRANLSTLVQKAKQYTSRIVIVGATKVDDEWRSVRGSRFLNEEIERFNTVMKEISTEHSLAFIDVFETLNPTSDLSDGLHPNAVGYQKLFDVIKNGFNFEAK